MKVKDSPSLHILKWITLKCLQRPDELEEEIAEIRKGAKGIYSQGLINISLLSSNATQLRSAQSKTESRNRTTVICLILVSIVIQIIILLLLFALCIIPKGKVYRNRPCCTWKWLQMNRILCKSLVLFFVSILTAVNVFISAYHIDWVSYCFLSFINLLIKFLKNNVIKTLYIYTVHFSPTESFHTKKLLFW